MMLGAVKMEGHEHTDWSTYYGEPEVGTFHIYECVYIYKYIFLCPPSPFYSYNSILALR